MTTRLLDLVLILGVLCPPVAAVAGSATQRLTDKGEASYECQISDGFGRIHSVRRVTVERPSYAVSLAGYEAILVRILDRQGTDSDEEVLTSLVPGVIRLSAYDPSGRIVYGFRMKPQGASWVVAAIERFSQQQPQGEAIGPVGAYQYASCDSTATFCLLVDDQPTLVDLRSGTVDRIELPQPIPFLTADPPVVSAEGDQLGGGELSNLSGDHLEAIWGTGSEVALVIRNAEGRETAIYRIDLKSGRQK